jgi:hypothetical protein
MGYAMAMRALSVVLLPVVFLAGSLQVWSQATTGSISGHVTDPAGSVVQGAQVSIRDVDTGIITTTITNSSGEFIQTALPPDHYTVSVQSAGFDTATVAAFELNIDQRARFDVPLKVGTVSSSVEVTSAAPLLQLQGQKRAR